MIYFTSDTHFGHANVIKYSNRPFKNVDDMNAELIRRWNSRVCPTDTVYHLGDVATIKDPSSILEKLNGVIHLCPGNHDSKKIKTLGRWASVVPYREMRLDGYFLVLSHYAHRVWNKCHYGSLMLYGHSHGSMPGNRQSVDVGVDCWDWHPVTLTNILSRMANFPPFRSEDHHNAL